MGSRNCTSIVLLPSQDRGGLSELGRSPIANFGSETSLINFAPVVLNCAAFISNYAAFLREMKEVGSRSSALISNFGPKLCEIIVLQSCVTTLWLKLASSFIHHEKFSHRDRKPIQHLYSWFISERKYEEVFSKWFTSQYFSVRFE